MIWIAAISAALWFAYWLGYFVATNHALGGRNFYLHTKKGRRAWSGR